MSYIYLWTDTDSQLAPAGIIAPPVDDWFPPPVVNQVCPVIPMLWLFDQNDLPQLQAVDDDGWTLALTAGTSIIVRADPSGWANDELPQALPVTPNEDWNILPLIGIPVVVPPPSRMAEYLWHQDEREAPPTAIFPSDDAVLQLMLVILSPPQLISPMAWEQHDWNGVPPVPAVNQSHRGALRMGLGLRIR